ncbi:hypothetical protein CEXT_442491 [Caerostris extrusa]|uniref:Uncharacterized protein n=1 Tax=Caerostris extrusa TaxID=172846 RepID=A0AAV4WWP6_CAEEX|nr:hypothetical protein CEXT_442491 [Caerostris extrusa]
MNDFAYKYFTNVNKLSTSFYVIYFQNFDLSFVTSECESGFIKSFTYLVVPVRRASLVAIFISFSPTLIREKRRFYGCGVNAADRDHRPDAWWHGEDGPINRWVTQQRATFGA